MSQQFYTIQAYEEAKAIMRQQQSGFHHHAKAFHSLRQAFRFDVACFTLVTILCLCMLTNAILSINAIIAFIVSPIFVATVIASMICYDHAKECEYHIWHCQKLIKEIDSTITRIDARIKELENQ